MAFGRIDGVRCWLAAAILFAPAILFAQAGETDVGEVSAFGGGSFSPGTHPYVGGSSAIAFSKHGMAYFQVSWTPLGHDILWRRPDVQSPRESQLFDFTVGGHIRFPIRDRWAPYAILGGGLAFNTFRAYAGPHGALIGIEDFKGLFQTGAGLRYYVGQNWGIRPEVNVVVSSRTFTRVSIGVFYVVPPHWP